MVRLEGLSDNTVHRFAAPISLGAVLRSAPTTTSKASPATVAVAPAATKSTKKIPTADEVAKLLRAAEDYGHDMGPAIAVAALTGARAGKVSAPRWAHVDLKRGTSSASTSRRPRSAARVSIKGTKTGDERTAKVEGRNLAVLPAVGPAGTGRHVRDRWRVGAGEPWRAVRSVRVHPSRCARPWCDVPLAAQVPSPRRWHLAGIPGPRGIADSIGWKSTRMLDVYVGGRTLVPTQLQPWSYCDRRKGTDRRQTATPTRSCRTGSSIPSRRSPRSSWPRSSPPGPAPRSRRGVRRSTGRPDPGRRAAPRAAGVRPARGRRRDVGDRRRGVRRPDERRTCRDPRRPVCAVPCRRPRSNAAGAAAVRHEAHARLTHAARGSCGRDVRPQGRTSPRLSTHCATQCATVRRAAVYTWLSICPTRPQILC